MRPPCLTLPLLALIIIITGCANSKIADKPVPSSLSNPIQVETIDLTVTLSSIAGPDTPGALIEDPGWREYVLNITNTSTESFTIQNVKLLNQEGRYFDSASSYGQIIAPPDAAVATAGNVANTAAGIAAGQVIPFGGTIYGMLTGAASASSAETKAGAKRAFALRVLKNIELDPEGKVEGSAFLPNIVNPKRVVLDYSKNGSASRVKIDLPKQALSQ